MIAPNQDSAAQPPVARSVNEMSDLAGCHWHSGADGVSPARGLLRMAFASTTHRGQYSRCRKASFCAGDTPIRRNQTRRMGERVRLKLLAPATAMHEIWARWTPPGPVMLPRALPR